VGVPAMRVVAAGLCSLSALSFLVGAAAAALAYRGRDGERFAFRNHYVSELGEQGVSRLAAVFNASLVVGGLAALPGLVLFGVDAARAWSAIPGVVSGVGAGLTLAVVGFFPVNRYSVHIVAARTFFMLFFFMQSFVTVTVLFGNRAGSPAAALLLAGSVCCALSYIGCLFGVPALTGTRVGYFHTRVSAVRPRIVPLAIAEWSVYFSATFWTAAFAIFTAVSSL
jgi:hypothetical membrane protein